MSDELQTNGAALGRKFRFALAGYAALAALIWFTMDDGRVLVQGRSVELRWVPLLIVGGFALKTVLAYQANRIRRGGNVEGS